MGVAQFGFDVIKFYYKQGGNAPEEKEPKMCINGCGNKVNFGDIEIAGEGFVCGSECEAEFLKSIGEWE